MEVLDLLNVYLKLIGCFLYLRKYSLCAMCCNSCNGQVLKFYKYFFLDSLLPADKLWFHVLCNTVYLYTCHTMLTKNVCSQDTDYGNDFIIVFVLSSFHFINFLSW